MMAVDRSRLPRPGPPRPFLLPDDRPHAARQRPRRAGRAARRGAGRLDGRRWCRAAPSPTRWTGRGWRRSPPTCSTTAPATLDGVGLADALARIGAELDVEVWPDATVITVTDAGAPRRARGRPAGRPADAAALRRRRRRAGARAAPRPAAADARAGARPAPIAPSCTASTAAIPTATTASATPPASAPRPRRDPRRSTNSRCTPAAMTLVVGGSISTRPRRIGWSRAPSAAGAATSRRRCPISTPPCRLPDRSAPWSCRGPARRSRNCASARVGVARTTPDYHALVLWNAVLGGQFVSRLNLHAAAGEGLHLRGALGVRLPSRSRALQRADQRADQRHGRRGRPRSCARWRRCVDGAPPTADELRGPRRRSGRGYPRGFETAQQVARARGAAGLHDICPTITSRSSCRRSNAVDARRRSPRRSAATCVPTR